MLGGTSFSAIKLTFLLWKQTGVEITFPLLVQHPTVRQIAMHVLSHTRNLPDAGSGVTATSHSTSGPQLSHSSSIKTRENVQIVCLQEQKSDTDPKLFLVHPAFWSSVSYLDMSTHFVGVCAVYLAHPSTSLACPFLYEREQCKWAFLFCLDMELKAIQVIIAPPWNRWR